MERTYKCQVCGRQEEARNLYDLKGNVPGGCKVTCLACVARLEEREACAKVADCVAEKARSRAISSSGIGRATNTIAEAVASGLAAAIRTRSNAGDSAPATTAGVVPPSS